MAVITNSNLLDTEFTPSAGTFIASSTKRAALLRKNSSGGQFCVAGMIDNEAVNVDNPVAGAVYMWRAGDPSTVVSADQ